MTDFEKLQQMDIKDVHKKTCITIARLQDIMNKNFDNMDSATRTYGFIKILERELQLDLKDWVQEYNHYKQYGNIQSHEMVYTEENKQDTVNQDVLGQQDSHISPTTDPLPAIDTSKQKDNVHTKIQKKNIKRNSTKNNNKHLNNTIEISIPQTKSSYKTVWIIMISVIIILIVAGIYFINLASHTNSHNAIQQNNMQQKNIENKQAHPQISLIDALSDKEDIDMDSETQTPLSTQQQSQSVTVDSKEDMQTSSLNVQRTLTIVPKKEVWFAWVDTVKKTRGEKYTKTPYTLTLTNNTAFHFGNAILTLEIDGKKYEYNQYSITYLLYDFQEGFKPITQKEYRALGAK